MVRGPPGKPCSCGAMYIPAELPEHGDDTAKHIAEAAKEKRSYVDTTRTSHFNAVGKWSERNVLPPDMPRSSSLHAL